jgi:hypothetical protein
MKRKFVDCLSNEKKYTIALLKIVIPFCSIHVLIRLKKVSKHLHERIKYELQCRNISFFNIIICGVSWNQLMNIRLVCQNLKKIADLEITRRNYICTIKEIKGIYSFLNYYGPDNLLKKIDICNLDENIMNKFF